MSIKLKSKSELYDCLLCLFTENNSFTFEFSNSEKCLKGSGSWTAEAGDYIINFTLFQVHMTNGKSFPENSIPYAGRRLIKNEEDTSYTLEGYFNPEDIVLILYLSE